MAANKSSYGGTCHLRSLHLWRADEHHRDAQEAVAFDDDAAFRPDLKSFCALKEIFTVVSLCASMSQWQKEQGRGRRGLKILISILGF